MNYIPNVCNDVDLFVAALPRQGQIREDVIIAWITSGQYHSHISCILQPLNIFLIKIVSILHATVTKRSFGVNECTVASICNWLFCQIP